MTPSMRGKKKQHPPTSGHTTPQSSDHSAMADGGPGRGVAGHDEMDDVETTASRKRKRGHNSTQRSDGELSPSEPNGNNGEISDGDFPEIGFCPLSVD